MIKIRKKKPVANELQGIANHDANGNMTVMPGLKAKYDAWNRLVDVRNSDDVLIATYEYNGLHQRIKKTVNSVVTKSFFNENWQELESVSNNQTTSYIWGLRYIDDLILREKGTERLYSLADPNWNVVAIVNTSGTVVERMKYDAFGSVSWLDAAYGAKAASTYNWNRTFTGQVLDSETLLMLYRNRYYNTLIGRWTSRDPIGYQGDDENLYRYVFNNTVKLCDIFGTDSKDIPKGEENIKKHIQQLADELRKQGKTDEQIADELKKIRGSLCGQQLDDWKWAEKHGGWRNKAKRGKLPKNIKKKALKIIPVIGIISAFYYWSEDIETKGFVYGTINTVLDGVPYVGVVKGIGDMWIWGDEDSIPDSTE